MTRKFKLMARITSVFAVVLLVLFSMAGTAAAQESQYSTALSGANEVDGAGDPDGAGTASVTINSISSEVCFAISVTGIADASAAHIHEAGAGSNGGVVVNFDWPATLGNGCVASDAQTVAKITANPALYYVNVHNADFPAGAVRGQLAGESAPPAAAAADEAAAATAAEDAADAAAAASTDTAAETELAITGSNLTPILALVGALFVFSGLAVSRTAGRSDRD